MTTRTITTAQLRGMIKEALEESIVEISLDEQIAALKAKGSKRTLQETKQYRRLLEEKKDMMLMGQEEEEGMEETIPGFSDVTEEEAAVMSGQGDEVKGAAFEFILDKMMDPANPIGQKVETIARMTDPSGAKKSAFLAAVARLIGVDKGTEIQRAITGMRKLKSEPVVESRRFLRRR